MRKSQKILILFIAIFLVLIVIISLLLFNYNKNDYSPNKNNKEENLIYTENNSKIDEEIEKTTEIKLEYVNDRTNYFTIKSLCNKYINLLQSKDAKSLLDILSKEYINKYGISANNVVTKHSVPEIKNDSQYYKINITNMLTVKIDASTELYIVDSNCRIVNGDERFAMKLLFELDTSNKTYCIYPQDYISDNKYDALRIGDYINYTKEEINKNSNNKYEYIYKNDLEMATEYMNDYKELLQKYPNDAYNKLDSEYSKKRFESKENFETYLEDNKMNIALMTINEYKVISNNSYTDYICSDKYGNIYIFRQQDGIMNYTVVLDDYTIMSEEETNTYNDLEEFDKLKYNLYKFIKMVNTKDYNAIYNVLNSTFRNNNFSNIEELKTYLKTNMYDINSIEIEDCDNETYEYYVCSCKIKNKRNEKETKNMTIIINQGEGTDFTMSFSFN